MHLLITRPEPDAQSLAERLEKHGHQCTISPLLKLTFPEPPQLDAGKPQALIITSRNALRALKHHPQRHEIFKFPLFLVGANSAEIAEKAGFTNIAAIARNAASLAQIIASQCSPDQGPLLYLSGSQLAFDMEKALGDHGFAVKRTTLYEMKPADGFSNEAKEALRSGAIDAVIHLSPRTATIFSDLIKRHELKSITEKLIHFCLSENIAKNLEHTSIHNIHITANPDISSMIALIKDYKS